MLGDITYAIAEKKWWSVFSLAVKLINSVTKACLLYTSDAADDLLCVDLGGRRILKKKLLHYTLSTTHVSS